MSNLKDNFNGDKFGITFADVNISSQNTPFSSDMSGSSKKENPNIKFEETEVTFDSGILSESNLSSEIISETDIKCTDFPAKYDGKSNIFCEKIARIKEETYSTDNIKLETGDPMRQDSGIDIDVSDQFSGSKTDNSGFIEKGTSYTACEEIASVNENVSIKSSVPLTSKDVCEFIFQQDDDGDTKLHLAIIQGQEEVVNQILQIVPDSHYLDIRNYYRQTSLHLSVIMNRPKITRILLLAGAKTGIEDRNGNTALHLACRANHLECVIALLQPLTVYEQKYATFKYKPEIDSPSEYLNEYNYDGLSCVHIAAVHKDLKVLRELFLYGADVNIRECKAGYTILHEAVKCGNFNLVNYVLQHSGIDIERRNYARFTSYQLSSYYPKIGQILLEKGASPLCRFDEENDEDDYSSSEFSDTDDDFSDENLQGYVEINQISDRICSLSANGCQKYGPT